MYVPDLKPLTDPETSPLQDVMIQFHADERALGRRFPVSCSEATWREHRAFYDEWTGALDALDYETLSPKGRVDWHLMRRRIRNGRLNHRQNEKKFQEAAALLPFAPAVIALEEQRLAVDKIAPREAGQALSDAAQATRALRENAGKDQIAPLAAASAAQLTRDLKKHLENFRDERLGYDPVLSWWIEKPCTELVEALEAHEKFLREDVVGEKDGQPAPVHNVPLGRDFICEALRNEYVAYPPEELFDIAEKELLWCEGEMKTVAEELGFKDDRPGAIEHVKNLHAEPGEQPFVAKALAEEAIAFLEERELVTIPEHAKRIWRHKMITPEHQKNAPFLLGGETIWTSYSHRDMPHETKLSSMRSNNGPFMQATVHHELIPGHHLQMYMQERRNAYRRGYGTPFCGEGWPLYWEVMFYRLGLPKDSAYKLGFLFWRMHRCARIMVVLGFHIGKLSTQDCLDLIIGRVGHEVAGGTSQVRWLTSGGASPLYGAAYMLGALQILGLRKELVDGGKMTDLQFHDGILAENSMPIELLRAAMTGRSLERDHEPEWRFYAG